MEIWPFEFEIKKIIKKLLFSNGKRSSEPKYHIPRWKKCDGWHENKNVVLYKGKIQKPIKSVKMKILKNPKTFSYLSPKDHSTQKLGS